MPPATPVLDAEQPADPLPAPETRPDDAPDTEEPAILEELLIEEVDIDGMCGVY